MTFIEAHPFKVYSRENHLVARFTNLLCAARTVAYCQPSERGRYVIGPKGETSDFSECQSMVVAADTRPGSIGAPR